MLASYLVGSVPFALWLSQYRASTDLRQIGSRNVGSTNVWRVAGAPTGLAVLALDVGKGLAVVLCVRELGVTVSGQALAAGAVVGGHVFPVWLKFKGGKGVATTAGAFSVLTPWAIIIAAGVFVAVVCITRFVSVGSLAATVSLVPLAFVEGAPPPVLIAVCGVCLLIVTRRHSNVARLVTGDEQRLGCSRDD